MNPNFINQFDPSSSPPPTVISQKFKLSTKIRNVMGTEFPRVLRTHKTVADCTLKSGLNISFGKFTFHENCKEFAWNELNCEADALESDNNPDYKWVASEQNNRNIRIFPNGKTLEELFDVQGLLSNENLGWEVYQDGGCRNIILVSVPLNSNNATRVGILVGNF